MPATPVDPDRATTTLPSAPPWQDARPVVARNSPRTQESVPLAARTIDLAELDEPDAILQAVASPAPMAHVDAVGSRLKGPGRTASVAPVEALPPLTIPGDVGLADVGPRALLVYVAAFLGGLALGTAALVLLGRSLTAPETTPAPTPAVVAAPQLARTPGVQGLVNEGFALVETRPVDAADRFRAALEQEPDHAAATLGLGQALLVQGREDEGRKLVCRVVYERGAIGSAARSVLESYGLGCGG